MPSFGGDPGFEPESPGLLAYWRILKRRKAALIVLGTLGGLIGFLVTLPQTPIYQVHASVEIMSLNQNFLNVREATPVDNGTAGDYMDIQTQLRILQSSSLLDRVAEQVQAAAPPAAPVSRTSAWRKVLNLPEPEPVDFRTEALNYARGSLQARVVGDTRIIELTVDSVDPAVAADFANTVANEFIDQSVEARFETTERTGEFLSRQIDDMRIRLEQSEDRLQQYANRAGLLFTDAQTNVSEERLSQLQESLSAAQTDRILKQSRWEIARASRPEALSDVLNDSTLREYQGKLTELNRQLAELRQTYQDESQQVRRVLAQIQPIESALRREQDDILKRIRNEYEEAAQREQLLSEDYAAQRGVVTGESEKAIQYNIFKREVESNRALYDSMLQQLKQASLASALRASNIRVVDAAKVPGAPYKPSPKRNAMLGAMVGLVLAGALVIVREQTDRSIQDPGETRLYVDLPELGIIPQEPGRRLRLPGFAATTRAALPGPARDSGDDPQRASAGRRLVIQQPPSSALTESFRATLVSILFSGQNSSRPRVMVVTSANPTEGKTTVVSNLGVAVAEVNQRVLLVDADLRKPRLHEVFHLKNDRGLSDILRSQDSAAELPEGVIHETTVPGLYVLTSGPSTSAATSILYSNRMPELLKTLRMQFETILVDTPPMLQISDARVLGRLADRVILVVRAKKTTRDALCAACQRFSEDGTPVLGTILNDWNPERSANGYYGYYSNYYHYSGGYYHNGKDQKTSTGE